MEEIKEACGIKIGEYIRTSGYDSFIAKIKKIEFDNEALLFWFVYDYKDFDTNITKEWRINKPYITKHSSNIIDLIEVGDYVNGHLVVDIYTDLEDFGDGCTGIEVESDLQAHKLLTKKHIKSICTKEKFNQMKYILDYENLLEEVKDE